MSKIRKPVPRKAATLPEPKRFYDYGWNAFINGEPFEMNSTIDWKDGWTDCSEADPIDRIVITNQIF